MTPELFERLLYSPESDSLDFKEKQYQSLSSPDGAKRQHARTTRDTDTRRG